ncbi:uncharacterized protein DMENIID0001_127040 [Sergentomyia squamirostris]
MYQDVTRIRGCLLNNCARVSSEEVKVINDKKTAWKCLDCDERNLSIADGGQSSNKNIGDKDGPSTVSTIAIAELREDMQGKLANIVKNVQEFNAALETLENVVKDCEEVQRRVDVVEVRVTEAEKALLLDTLEIHGVLASVSPRDAGEKLVLAANILQAATGIAVHVNDIDECFIVKNKSGNKKQNGRSSAAKIVGDIWVVKMTTRRMRHQLLSAAREMVRERDDKTLLCAIDDWQNINDFRVRLLERLSPTTRTLLAMAREFAAKNSWAFVWIRDGRILMKKTKEDGVIHLSSSQELLKLQ